MENHPIYTTLARPKLLKGVPRDYSLLAMIISALFFEISMPFIEKIILCFAATGTVFLVLWIVGWILAKRDPEFLHVIRTKRLSLGQTKVIGAFEGNSYIP